MRLLVAEDEHDLNDLITQRLTMEHYSVDSCYDGEEALDYLRMAEYDALILDIMMPKLDGDRGPPQASRKQKQYCRFDADGKRQHRRSCQRTGCWSR